MVKVFQRSEYIFIVSKGKDSYEVNKKKIVVRYWDLIFIFTQMLSIALFAWYKQQIDEKGQYQYVVLKCYTAEK